MQRHGYRPMSSKRLMDHHRRKHNIDPVGLVAGWGSFPVEVARALIQSGRGVCCIGIHGHADRQLETLCDHVKWSGVGKIGAHVRYFRKHGIREVAMAGKLFKADILYQGPVLLRHLPDLTALRTFGPLLFGRKRDARDDRLLTAVTNTYTRAGLTVCPATDFAPELLVKDGLLAGPDVTSKIQSDIDRGWDVAKAMGGMDIGQTITIKDGAVIAVEAIEGTDACIERTGTLCRRGGWTMVKVAKPNQDMRFDVPTIGPQTVQKVAAAGGKAIAIESGMTIMVQQDETIAAAKQAGISIVAMDSARLRLVSDTA